MLHVDLSRPPPTSDPAWLHAFMHRLRALNPVFSNIDAEQQAIVARTHTWLLDPDEAALIWHRALCNRRHGGASPG